FFAVVSSSQRVGRMTDSPSTKRKSEPTSDGSVKKRKDALTIMMPIDPSLQDGEKLISPAHTFDGLIWRLHVKSFSYKDIDRKHSELAVSVYCEGDELSEMWRTFADIHMSYTQKDGVLPFAKKKYKWFNWFASWEEERNKFVLMRIPNPMKAPTTSISVTIDTNNDSFARRPIIDPKSSINDVVLVLEQKEFPVNKQFLAAQSSYFNSLFYDDFKESTQEGIEIKATDPEIFGELMTMAYGQSKEPTTVENATRCLPMADMFDLQIVKDRIENFLISTKLISIHRKFLIAEEHKLKILKDKILFLYKTDKKNLRELRQSEEFANFPDSLVKNFLFGIACGLPG
ncbi:hypothetical protein PENTCL1PPCAC_19840, partial [Pristionchus entomophagus]